MMMKGCRRKADQAAPHQVSRVTISRKQRHTGRAEQEKGIGVIDPWRR